MVLAGIFWTELIRTKRVSLAPSYQLLAKVKKDLMIKICVLFGRWPGMGIAAPLRPRPGLPEPTSGKNVVIWRA